MRPCSALQLVARLRDGLAHLAGEACAARSSLRFCGELPRSAASAFLRVVERRARPLRLRRARAFSTLRAIDSGVSSATRAGFARWRD